MRPLRLRIKGLRSFRTERLIDFSDLGLVAIVGDTGAGKSSILEAITYALYNATTWEQRGVKQLISDGASAMSVELEFAVDGHQYRITRSTSRSAYPPPGHELESLTDASFARLDSEDAIKTAIIRLIGLDWNGFTSAVILPQGRFQTLLQASPADRTEILKGIFRLRELAEAREYAQTLAARYRGALEDIQETRMQLLPDPAAAAKEAAQRKREAAKQEKQLREQKVELAKQDATAKAEDSTAEKLEATASSLAADNVTPSRDLKTLLPILNDLDAKAATLKATQDDTESEEERLKGALERATEAGESESELARAKAVLEQLISEHPQLQEEEQLLLQSKSELASDEATLEKDEAALTDLRAEADRTGNSHSATEREAQQARKALQDAKDRLAALRTTTKDERRETDAVTRLERQLETATKKAETATKAESTAEARLSAATETLELLRREHAAAHAAQGLKPGDPCPICQKSIPAGFKPPQARAERAAHKAQTEAEAAARAAREERATAAAACRQLTQELDEQARPTAKQARQATAAAIKRVQAVLDEVDTSASDSDLLRPLEETLETQEQTLETRRVDAAEARDTLVAAEAALAPRRKSLNEQRTALERHARNLEKTAASLERDRLTLPAHFQPAPTATQTQREKLLERLDKRLTDLQRLRREQEAAQRRLTEIRRDRDDLATRRQREFEEPRRRTANNVLLLHRRADEVASLADAQAPSPPDEDSAFTDYIVAVEALEQTANAIVATLKTKAKEARTRATAARRAIEKALKQTGAQDTDELERLLISASADAKRAKDDETEARRQTPIAADLDRRILPLRDSIGVLEELAGLLTDGRFIGYIVSRRQLALLGLASEILGSMTGARYGFAEDFRIIDRISGQPRNARTLSGGETFLASLALALALVELAARGGGRLEALFLDEGFGSLDADALDEALGELERHAQAGQLVAVISHIRAVAERIEDVLRVSRTPEGSEVAPITGTEREDFVTEEVEEKLLA
jgi:exonuclease SbcC